MENKRVWKRPEALAEEFQANEYVAACLAATLECAIPGKSIDTFEDGIDSVVMPAGDFTWNGLHLTFNNLQYGGEEHDICANPVEVNLDTSNGKLYEVVNGKTDYNRPIWGISNFDKTPGDHLVTWQSTDGNTGTYNHFGRIHIFAKNEKRPNNS